jgi:NADPH2:quinone reductase
VAYGSNAPQASFEFGPMILSGAAVRFFIVYELAPAARERGIADLTRWLEQGRLRHAIGAKLPLERTIEAHELVEQGKVIGNVVVQP